MKNHSCILNFFKKEIVFEIAFLLALASTIYLASIGTFSATTTTDSDKVSFAHHIVSSIDFRVLSILLSLMLVVAGLQKIGFFTWSANFLCHSLTNLRSLSIVLILLCFFSSMFITNDVSLITFVPFTLMILSSTQNFNRASYIVVLQTIAANLGSMLTPIGNPQNLFLFSKMNLSLSSFMLVLLPYTILSLVLLLLCTLFIPKTSLPRKKIEASHRTTSRHNSKKTTIIGAILFSLLFVLCILCVLSFIPYYIVLPIVFFSVAIFDYKLLLKADYMLLLTFCSFFIFTHNISLIPVVKDSLQNVVNGHEFWVSLALSQIISNVPATLLLYPFCADAKNLLLGVDIGGLGTLIASLASLISFKIYTNFQSAQSSQESITSTHRLPTLKYLGIFTLMNIVFLIVLIILFKFAIVHF